jgi:hypothetical protein
MSMRPFLVAVLCIGLSASLAPAQPTGATLPRFNGIAVSGYWTPSERDIAPVRAQIEASLKENSSYCKLYYAGVLIPAVTISVRPEGVSSAPAGDTEQVIAVLVRAEPGEKRSESIVPAQALPALRNEDCITGPWPMTAGIYCGPQRNPFSSRP